MHLLTFSLPEDSWEVARCDIEIGVKLGQGNYGAVFRGQLSMMAMSPKIYAHKQEMESEGKSHLTVAVKMLRRENTGRLLHHTAGLYHHWVTNKTCTRMHAGIVFINVIHL